MSIRKGKRREGLLYLVVSRGIIREEYSVFIGFGNVVGF